MIDESIIKAVKDNVAAADREVQAWQAALKPGDYFAAMPEPGVVIYYLVCDPVADEIANGADSAQVEWTRRSYASEALRNMRACRGFSPLTPEGEYGDAHVADAVARLTEAQFAQARAAGWPYGLDYLRRLLA